MPALHTAGELQSVSSGGPSDGKLKVNDIIIALNNQKITNGDDLATYLEENTLPGDRLVLAVIRGTAQIQVTVVLGARPAPNT